MAVRLYPKEHVEYELFRRDCRKLRDYKTCSLWCTRGGYFFTVPMEPPDGRTNEYSLNNILMEIDTRQAPPT